MNRSQMHITLPIVAGLILMLAGCGSEEGPDALSSHGQYAEGELGCAACHSIATGSRRQIVGAGGDFDRTSHHVIDYSNGNNEIVSDADCLVCHDLGAHGSGTIRLNHKDNAGQVIVYQPGNPASLEPFCLSCHDADGARTEAAPMSPFSSTNTLGTIPNAAGVKIKESWEKQNGHRREGLTCMGSGATGTGCHGNYDAVMGTGTINAHGSGNVGLLANKLTLPITTSAWDETRYTLCLDCHNSHPSLLTISELVGVAAGGNYAQPQLNYGQWPYTVDFMVTGFQDYLSYNYDRQFNLHLYHLIEGMGQWYYRGLNDSILSCVACHNVHGVDGQQYYLWDEWNFSTEIVAGVLYGKVDKADVGGDFGCVWQSVCEVSGGSIPSEPAYPEFCNANCHWDWDYRYPISPFNEAKAVAQDTSGGAGLGSGDTVTLYFSDSTNGPLIDEMNIDTVLALSSGHSWIDSDKGGAAGVLTAAWSDADGKTANVLTITIYIANPGFGDPTIAVNDSIILDLATITDVYGNPVRGMMTVLGSF